MAYYRVIKYIDDVVRNEPINVAIFLRSRETNNKIFRSVIPSWIKNNKAIKNKFIFELLLRTLSLDFDSVEDDEDEDKIIKEFTSTNPILPYDFIFTERRGTIAEVDDNEMEELWRIFINEQY